MHISSYIFWNFWTNDFIWVVRSFFWWLWEFAYDVIISKLVGKQKFYREAGCQNFSWIICMNVSCTKEMLLSLSSIGGWGLSQPLSTFQVSQFPTPQDSCLREQNWLPDFKWLVISLLLNLSLLFWKYVVLST